MNGETPDDGEVGKAIMFCGLTLLLSSVFLVMRVLLLASFRPIWLPPISTTLAVVFIASGIALMMWGRTKAKRSHKHRKTLVREPEHAGGAMKSTNDDRIDLAAALGTEARDLLVNGVRALWRERVAAWNAAENDAAQKGNAPPDRSAYGIEEAARMLRRLGT